MSSQYVRETSYAELRERRREQIRACANLGESLESRYPDNVLEEVFDADEIRELRDTVTRVRAEKKERARISRENQEVQLEADLIIRQQDAERRANAVAEARKRLGLS